MAADFEGALRVVARIVAELDAHDVVVSEDAWAAPWNVGRLPDFRTSGPSDLRISTLPRRSRAVEKARPSDFDLGITLAAYGMADTGTIVVCSSPAGGRLESLLPPVHIALLPASRLVAGLPDLLPALRRDRRFERSSAVTLITGPSRTADIELTLTIGVHGPKRLFIVLVDDVAPNLQGGAQAPPHGGP